MDEKLHEIDEVIDRGPYKDDWASLSAYRVPDWYKKLKFGIFIHYGLFSVPAYDTEWYPRMMYVKDSKAYKHHIETYGPHNEFGLKDFIPMFKAGNFDAARWADIFKASGAQYVIPVAEHHDGFQMYGSDLSSYNCVDMGPHRNIAGELKEAVEGKGMVFGLSSHRIEHFFFLGEGRDFDSDIKGEFSRGDMYWPSVKGPKDFDAADGECSPTEEFMQDWLVRTCEIVDKYRPSVMYFDWWIQRVELKPYLKKFIAYYYNRAVEWGREVVINYKHDAIPFGIAVPDVERGQFSVQKPYKWQSDTAMAFNSWCHTDGNTYKKPEDILCDLVDIISKNGTLLLNIGPREDGTFTDEETAILERIGEWIRLNGEALYESEPYKIYGEGPTKVEDGGFNDGKVKEFTSGDFRFLAGRGCTYVIALRPAEDGIYRVTSFGKRQGAYNTAIREIIRPDTGERAGFEHTADALVIKSTMKASGEYKMPVVFKIEER
ncbi:MAG: alpha-L-fucosidase [Lachnospiraceae bacterium]|nr:alpha-L-fucosidase [Lachnospiraceae bacterium]